MTADPSGQSERPEFKPISGADADKFLIWCNGTEYGIDAQIANKDVLDAFRGFTIGDLKWLCQAIHQAQGIPDLAAMVKAIKSRDVAVLRSTEKPVKQTDTMRPL